MSCLDTCIIVLYTPTTASSDTPTNIPTVYSNHQDAVAVSDTDTVPDAEQKIQVTQWNQLYKGPNLTDLRIVAGAKASRSFIEEHTFAVDGLRATIHPTADLIKNNNNAVNKHEAAKEEEEEGRAPTR